MAILGLALGVGWSYRQPTGLTLHHAQTEPWQSGAQPRYFLRLAAGQTARLVLEQRGVDLLVEIAGDAGGPFEVDSPSGRHGDEHIFLAAEEDRTFVLTLRAFSDRVAADGEFQLRLEHLDRATHEDVLRAAAEGLFHRARVTSQGIRDGRWDAESDRRFGEAAALFAELNLSERRADALYLQGKLRYTAQRYQDAAASIRASLALFQRPDADVELGHVLSLLGEWDEAEASFLRALELYDGKGSSAEATALKGLGDLQKNRGHFEAADFHLRQAYEMFQRLGPLRKRIATLNSLGALQLRQGASAKALELLQQALRETPPTDQGMRGETLLALGNLHLSEGRLEAAAASYAEALRWERGKGSRHEAILLTGRGRVADGRGDRAGATQLYAKALEIFESLELPFDVAISRNNLAWLHLAEGNPNAARSLFEDAVRGIEPLGGSVFLEGVLHFGLARTASQLGDLELAEKEIEAAVEAVELLRAGSPFEDRITVLASRHDIFDFHISLLMQQHVQQPNGGYDRLALGVAEQAKARSLLDALGSELATTALGPGEDPWAETRRLAEGTTARGLELRALERRGEDPQAMVDLRQGLDDDIRQLQVLQQELAVSNPSIAAVRMPRQLVLRQIQGRLLDSSSRLLTYHLGRQGAFLWVVGQDSVRSYDLGEAAPIERLAQRLSLQMAGRLRPGAHELLQTTLRDLSKAVLPPAEGLVGVRRLVIVPSGELFRIPFATLPWPTANSEEPLLSSFEVVYLPSSSVLIANRWRSGLRRHPSEGLAIFADPVFGASDLRIPAPSEEAPANHVDLPRLGGTLDEAEAVVAALKNISPLTLLGTQARIDPLLEGQMAGFRYLHFATHGIAVEEAPELSYLMLSQLDDDGAWRDGRLTARQVTALELNADLVVLSACRSGPGRPILGEGLTGLARSFLLAGAQRVVVSQWTVDDRASVELMRRFYSAHAEGMPAAEALRRAQLELRRHRRWSDPYYWAGFALFGDWQ